MLKTRFLLAFAVLVLAGCAASPARPPGQDHSKSPPKRPPHESPPLDEEVDTSEVEEILVRLQGKSHDGQEDVGEVECLIWHPQTADDESFRVVARMADGKKYSAPVRVPSDGVVELQSVFKRHGALLTNEIDGHTGWLAICYDDSV
jgi:hypothetical protein